MLTFFVFTSNGQNTVDGYKIYRNLKKAVKHKDQVEAIFLTSKDLEVFPEEIFEMKNLKIINLTNNAISSIPEGISELKHLEKLDMMKNNLNELPLSIFEMKTLKRVNVGYNNIYDKDVIGLREALPNCLIIASVKM